MPLVQHGGPALREPAQYGREVVRRLAQRALTVLLLLVLLATGTALLAGWRSPTFFVVELVAVIAILGMDRVLTPELDRREQGNAGEIKVGRLLEELAEDGWSVLHDVQTGHGNIDHVLIGPAGILTVETKSHRGRVRVADLNVQWLKQAYAQAKHVERLCGYPAEPLLVFSDAYLIGRPVSRQRGVCVLPARMLREHLQRREGRLSDEEVEFLRSHVIAALCD